MRRDPTEEQGALVFACCMVGGAILLIVIWLGASLGWIQVG